MYRPLTSTGTPLKYAISAGTQHNLRPHIQPSNLPFNMDQILVVMPDHGPILSDDLLHPITSRGYAPRGPLADSWGRLLFLGDSRWTEGAVANRRDMILNNECGLSLVIRGGTTRSRRTFIHNTNIHIITYISQEQPYHPHSSNSVTVILLSLYIPSYGADPLFHFSGFFCHLISTPLMTVTSSTISITFVTTLVEAAGLSCRLLCGNRCILDRRV